MCNLNAYTSGLKADGTERWLARSSNRSDSFDEILVASLSAA
jgi:hypothetical protein